MSEKQLKEMYVIFHPFCVAVVGTLIILSEDVFQRKISFQTNNFIYVHTHVYCNVKNTKRNKQKRKPEGKFYLCFSMKKDVKPTTITTTFQKK